MKKVPRLAWQSVSAHALLAPTPSRLTHAGELEPFPIEPRLFLRQIPNDSATENTQNIEQNKLRALCALSGSIDLRFAITSLKQSNH